MRDKIIALAACSVIFIVVLVIALTTAVRGNARNTAATDTGSQSAVSGTPTAATAAAEKSAPEIPAETEPAANQQPVLPIQEKHLYKHPLKNLHRNFDFSRTASLPRNLAGYRFNAGILVDLDSGKVLWAKNAKTPVPIASLTKLLTIYTAFEEIERRKDIDLNTLVTVSLECTQTTPVRINLKPGEKVSLHELFIYSMLRSANDAAHLIAEYFGGGESSRFILRMNRKAASIGMTNGYFVNANGLPIYGKKPSDTLMNKASCLDMVKLIQRLYEYPMILRYTACSSKKTRHGTLNNGNRLLGKVRGMEGLKTGFTNAAGHCLAFSCRRDGRRLAGIVTGFRKRQNCFDFTAQLLEWGFKQH